MKEKNRSGIKSSFDLAMERLEQQSGKRPPLTEQQKKAMAEVDQEARARVAELEIMEQPERRQAEAAGDAARIQLLDERHRNEVRKIRESAEERKERIRSGRTG
jgi:hypothetical protein